MKRSLKLSHSNYIKSLGGLLSFVQIEKEKKLIRAGKTSVNSDVPPHLKTKALLKSCDSIKQIAQSRGVTEGTIINHLSTLKKEDSKIDLSKFKPKGRVVNSIKKMISKLKKEQKEENFSEDGKLRLKAIFDALNREVSYDKIRYVLLFV